MTSTERDALVDEVLEAVPDAVLMCGTLAMLPWVVRVEAANLIRREVARRITVHLSTAQRPAA